MQCPTCHATGSKVIALTMRKHGERVRTRACHYCATEYDTIEIDKSLFKRVLELVRAKRDLDQQLLDTLQWNTHDDARTTEKS